MAIATDSSQVCCKNTSFYAPNEFYAVFWLIVFFSHMQQQILTLYRLNSFFTVFRDTA